MVALLGCTPNPPPMWQSGGAQLLVQPARWERPDDDEIEILPNGTVVEDGEPILSVDRAGRVVDEDNEPVAILLPDGQVVGPDDRGMGRVGMSNASPPGRTYAWISVMPNGQVITYNHDGDREDGGVWRGCAGAALRTCTLISHVMAVRHYVDRSRTRVGVGIGVGIGR